MVVLQGAFSESFWTFKFGDFDIGHRRRLPVKISLTGRVPRVSLENIGSADSSEHNDDRAINGLGDVGSARRFSSWRY